MAAQFATTQWSEVLKAGSSCAPGARVALEDLCTAYWYPPTFWTLDLRAEKTFDVGDRDRIHMIVDAFNITNNDTILGQAGRINSGLNGRVREVLQGRTIRLGLRLVIR